MSSPNPKFAHWLNLDGSYDAICAECVATVGSAQNEGELTAYELDHICDRENKNAGGVAA